MLMDRTLKILLVVFIVLSFPCCLMGADGGQEVDQDGNITHKGKVSTGSGLAVGGACVGAGLAAIGGGYAIARVGGHCIDAMARQPEAAGSMFAPMIVTAAMIEGAMLFSIVIALIAVLKIV